MIEVISEQLFDRLSARLVSDTAVNLPRYLDGEKAQLIAFSSPYPEQRGFDVTAAEFCEWLNPFVDAFVESLEPVTGVIAHNIAFKRRGGGAYDLRVFDVPRLYERKGLHPVGVYTWDKLNPAIGGDLERYDHEGGEFIFVFGATDRFKYRPFWGDYAPKTVSKARTGNMRKTAVDGTHGGNGASLNERGARQSNFIRCSSSGGEKRPRAKGGSWPLGVAERLIHQFSDFGDLVVDPFCGVGTTLIAAMRTGRHGLGVDVKKAEIDAATHWLGLEARGLPYM